MNIFETKRDAQFAGAAFAAVGIDFDAAVKAGDTDVLKRGGNAPRLSASANAPATGLRTSDAEGLTGLERTEAALRARSANPRTQAPAATATGGNGSSAFRASGGEELSPLARTAAALRARRKN